MMGMGIISTKVRSWIRKNKKGGAVTFTGWGFQFSTPLKDVFLLEEWFQPVKVGPTWFHFFFFLWTWVPHGWMPNKQMGSVEKKRKGTKKMDEMHINLTFPFLFFYFFKIDVLVWPTRIHDNQNRLLPSSQKSNTFFYLKNKIIINTSKIIYVQFNLPFCFRIIFILDCGRSFLSGNPAKGAKTHERACT